MNRNKFNCAGEDCWNLITDTETHIILVGNKEEPRGVCARCFYDWEFKNIFSPKQPNPAEIIRKYINK